MSLIKTSLVEILTISVYNEDIYGHSVLVWDTAMNSLLMNAIYIVQAYKISFF